MNFEEKFFQLCTKQERLQFATKNSNRGGRKDKTQSVLINNNPNVVGASDTGHEISDKDVLLALMSGRGMNV